MLYKRSLRPTAPNWQRSVALALTLTLLCPPGGLLAVAQAQDAPPAVAPAALPPTPDTSSPGGAIRIPMSPVQPGPIKTILLFPLANAIPATDTSGGFSPDIVGARVEDAIKLRVNTIGRYKADSFSPNLPQIQRALQESVMEGLTENDLTPPYDDAAKGDKIASQVGTDAYLLGTIEALNVNPNTRNVSLTVSATLYYSATGAVAKSLAYTGHGISYNASDDPDTLLQSAINDVAGHIVSGLNTGAAQQPMHIPTVDTVRGSRSNNGSLLLGILLAAGIGLAISSSHHGGGSSSSGTTTTTTTGTGPSGPPSPPTTTVTGGSPPNPPATGG